MDTDKGEVTAWLDEWVNKQILNGGKFVSALADCVRLVQVIKHTVSRAPAATRSYWVYPRDAFAYRGSSVSDSNPLQVAFVIAGRAQ